MAVEPNSWPQWLLDSWPRWLESIGYPHTGVGDLSDLKVRMGVGQSGKWLGFVNSGWFYYNNVEQYNFVQVGSVLGGDRYGSSGTVTAPVSFRPAWGPVLVHGVVDDASGRNDGPYRQHHNSFQPGTILNWTASGTKLYASIPASSILVGMRDTSNLPMGAVDAVGKVINEKLYYYNTTTQRVFILPKDPTNLVPNVWADLLFTYPLLRFREVVVCEVDASGNRVVLPSYHEIQDVKAFRGTYTTIVSGFISSGYITHTLSGVYRDDWVVLDYWIAKSFVLKDHQTLQYFVGGELSSAYQDDFRVYYETSIPDVISNIVVNTPSSTITNLFNMNPLFSEGYRTGYLFHARPASAINTYWVPSKIQLYLDKDSICGGWAETIRIRMLVTGDNDLPIPYYPVNISVVGGSSILTLPASTTNGRGEVHYIVRPHATGSSTLTIRASCGVLSASAVATIVASSTLIDAAKWHGGFVHVVVTNDKTGRGAFRAFAAASMADGLPRNHTSYFTSELASEFHVEGDRTLTKQISVMGSISIPNLQALAEFGYVPQPNDKLFGYSNSAISKIIKGEA